MKVMVISPHPDDETLGAGGTLLKMKSEGHEIYWLNITNMKPEYGYTPERIAERNGEIQKVKETYGFDGFYNLELEPAGVDKIDLGKFIPMLKEVFEEVKPELLLLPYQHDVHSDHRVIFEAAYSCTKSFRAPYLKTVLAMEILSETDQAMQENGFVPNVFVDITDYIDKKIEIMNTYESEITAPPFPRNAEAIKGLAAYRGATAYYKYAEAFYLIKSRLD
ncbi:PIG-L deacetylase family protein [Pseudobutyrivibrio xylanivorans]|uniref:N-acetylglucosaminyl deacetylase, LmbE family n=1 Tax=Pseudobutyrivibrio xylanivorans DSM 14809 TaxID=1123012 RepID=A0A1M6GWT4_PSEXY|nr:PIG-L deacetylase family protein [Pseudobutyrivibrio xylanivorans]SHJ14431.1 N-acetylglucosaminyl deacetylase, LmbE family [Pseudobutyrivibrio xylanivorans DSM 14809]